MHFYDLWYHRQTRLLSDTSTLTVGALLISSSYTSVTPSFHAFMMVHAASYLYSL